MLQEKEVCSSGIMGITGKALIGVELYACCYFKFYQCVSVDFEA